MPAALVGEIGERLAEIGSEPLDRLRIAATAIGIVLSRRLLVTVAALALAMIAELDEEARRWPRATD